MGNTRREQSNGFGLVEMMVALVIGTLLTASAISLYLSGHQSFRVQSAISRMNENARAAAHYLAIDIRMAGYSGCHKASLGAPNVVTSAPYAGLTAEDALQDYDGSTSWPASWPPQPANYVAGTQALFIMYATNWEPVLQPMSNTGSSVIIPRIPPGYTWGSPFIISNCSSADAFSPTGFLFTSGNVSISHSTSNNTSNQFSAAYGVGSNIYVINSYLYYIGTDASGAHGLYRESVLAGSDAEIAAEIDNMSFSNGIDTIGAGNADEYLPASAVWAISPPSAGWPSVVAVRVSLVVESDQDHIAPSPLTYRFDGSLVTAPDHRLYKTMGFTVARRNQ